MEEKGAFLRVGVLIVLGTITLGGLVWFFGGDRLSHGVTLESYFQESVQGLDQGAPVKFRGVTLGRVTEIGLVSAEYAANMTVPVDRNSFLLVFVRYVIDPTRIGQFPDIKAMVGRGLRARLASQGLTGVTYIELDFVNPRQYPPVPIDWTPKVDVVPTIPSTLYQVQEAATQFLAKLNQLDVDKTLANVDGLVTDLRASLQGGDVHETLTRAATLLQTLDDTVRQADVPGLTGDIKATSQSARTVLQDPDIKRLLANASVAADRLAQASAKLQPLLASLQSASGRADVSLADIQRALGPVLRDVQAATGNLRETTETLRRYPSQVLLGSPPPRTQGQVR